MILLKVYEAKTSMKEAFERDWRENLRKFSAEDFRTPEDFVFVQYL